MYDIIKFNRGERYLKKKILFVFKAKMYASYFDFLFLLMTIPTLKRMQ